MMFSRKGNVGFDASDSEFAEGAVHATAGGLEGACGGGELDQHGVVEGRDHGTGVT